MSSTERSAITNAIWLCSNCHKLVDDDPGRFPVGLLFEWQQSHEQAIAEKVGKTGVKLRKKYEARHLEEFGRLSYLAERIVSEKDEYWEYRLTAEVLIRVGSHPSALESVKLRPICEANFPYLRHGFSTVVPAKTLRGDRFCFRFRPVDEC